MSIFCVVILNKYRQEVRVTAQHPISSLFMEKHCVHFHRSLESRNFKQVGEVGPGGSPKDEESFHGKWTGTTILRCIVHAQMQSACN